MNPEPPNVKLLLTPREAARSLGVSERTLWAMTNRHEIPHLRLRRLVRYPLAVLEEWISQQAGSAPAKPSVDNSGEA